jgi:hypothetical protein
MVIRNFPADAALEKGWDAVDQHCTKWCLQSDNLCVSDGRNPDCWAGQTALNAVQRQSWKAPVNKTGRGNCVSLSNYVDAVRDASPRNSGQLYSLFDFSIPRRCWGLFHDINWWYYDRAFGSIGFEPGYPSFPNLYVHPNGTVSGAHRDSKHSYFFLRLLRGRKLGRGWAMDTSVTSLPFGAAWEAMTGRFVDFEMRPGDILFGPSDGFHAVLTVEPSIAISTNYFPNRAPPPLPPSGPPPRAPNINTVLSRRTQDRRLGTCTKPSNAPDEFA